MSTNINASDIVVINNLVFEYPGHRALDNVSLSLKRGQITALVGPNGAGKSTLMRCLAGLDTPLAGSIVVNGINVENEPRLAHKAMGYLPDFFGLYKSLSVKRCLEYFAQAQGVALDNIEASAHRAAERLGLTNHLHKTAGSLSRGLAQRLAIAQALVHEPILLILDEPASGLDPEARLALSQVFLELKAQGVSLIVSSHILSELDEYADQMVIVKQGKIIEHTVLAAVNLNRVTLSLVTYQVHANMHTLLGSIAGIENVFVYPDRIVFNFSDDPQRQHQLLRTLIENGISVIGFTQEKTNLQSAYLQKINENQGIGL